MRVGLEDIACTHTPVCVASRVYHASLSNCKPKEAVLSLKFLLLGYFYYSNEKVIKTFELNFIIINTKEEK